MKTIIAIPNANERTPCVEMIDLMVDKTIWASVHIDFFLELDRSLYDDLHNRLPVKIVIQAAK